MDRGLHQVKVHTVSKIKKRIPEGTDPRHLLNEER